MRFFSEAGEVGINYGLKLWFELALNVYRHASSIGCRRGFRQNRGVKEKSVIDEYLDSISEPKRSTLEALLNELRRLLPEAEECISYAMPGFRIDGKVIAGFAAFKNHLSYFPHSGSVLPELADELVDYEWSTGALQFAIDQPLPAELVARLVAIRLRQINR
jgi:hypothetical protein